MPFVDPNLPSGQVVGRQCRGLSFPTLNIMLYLLNLKSVNKSFRNCRGKGILYIPFWNYKHITFLLCKSWSKALRTSYWGLSAHPSPLLPLWTFILIDSLPFFSGPDIWVQSGKAEEWVSLYSENCWDSKTVLAHTHSSAIPAIESDWCPETHYRASAGVC